MLLHFIVCAAFALLIYIITKLNPGKLIPPFLFSAAIGFTFLYLFGLINDLFEMEGNIPVLFALSQCLVSVISARFIGIRIKRGGIFHEPDTRPKRGSQAVLESKLAEKTAENRLLENSLEQKEQENAKLIQKIEELQIIHQNISNRLAALERNVVKNTLNLKTSGNSDSILELIGDEFILFQMQTELEKKELENNQLLAQLNELRVAHHNINSRLAAMELSVKTSQNDGGSVSGDELVSMLEDISKLTDEMRTVEWNLKITKELPSTGIKMLDRIFAYYLVKCEEENINFNLIIKGNIANMVEKNVDQGKLEVLISGHIHNAINAIESSGSPYRDILVVVGLSGKHFGFTVFDGGAPFKVDTLVRLGTERVSTSVEKKDGGIGFETTFKTLKEYNASLTIDEKEPGREGYSKSVAIRFDGNGKYIIKTYRPDNFPQSGRYIIIDNRDRSYNVITSNLSI
ncbi:MAG: hypothetical protein FWE91_08785 [Defluviitaleaceae bacterium]|nr:hypothetical protein [Defluviitaleaceae bacterium]